jgi:hypothetical protein
LDVTVEAQLRLPRERCMMRHQIIEFLRVDVLAASRLVF